MNVQADRKKELSGSQFEERIFLRGADKAGTSGGQCGEAFPTAGDRLSGRFIFNDRPESIFAGNGRSETEFPEPLSYRRGRFTGMVEPAFVIAAVKGGQPGELPIRRFDFKIHGDLIRIEGIEKLAQQPEAALEQGVGFSLFREAAVEQRELARFPFAGAGRVADLQGEFTLFFPVDGDAARVKFGCGHRVESRRVPDAAPDRAGAVQPGGELLPDARRQTVLLDGLVPAAVLVLEKQPGADRIGSIGNYPRFQLEFGCFKRFAGGAERGAVRLPVELRGAGETHGDGGFAGGFRGGMRRIRAVRFPHTGKFRRIQQRQEGK